MALLGNLLPSAQGISFLDLVLRHGMVLPKPRGLAPLAFHGHFTSSGVQLSDQIQRRSANYKPPNWDNERPQTLKNEYALVLIGFENPAGTNVYREVQYNKGLYETALEFRLLRQHHFNVPQEVFDCFRCEKGNFKTNLSEDTKGLLCLYEASFLQRENDSTLELAREFATKNLSKCLEEKTIDQELTALVSHALELPLHWRMLRLEARWFIDVYEKRPDMNPTILELAKLDFNIVQEAYQMDLEYVSSWWKSTDFAESFRFARDRLVENFFWTIGVNFYPEYGYCRRMSTKVNALITTLDDIYDVYGTLDELELFTVAVERWDINAIDQLPDYMKIYYLEFYNSINEMAYDTLKEQGFHIISYLRKAWTDLCRAYLQEAKWYSEGYIPTLQEYLNNAWISISAPVILVHAYFLVSKPIQEEALECLEGRYHNIIRCSAMILRLSNDLGTSLDELKRGDVPKSIQCYMKETGKCEEDARRYIRFLISETWKEINKEQVRKSHFSETFIETAMNLGRMAQCMYQNGDGHGHQDSITKERISALLFDPIGLSKA